MAFRKTGDRQNVEPMTTEEVARITVVASEGQAEEAEARNVREDEE